MSAHCFSHMQTLPEDQLFGLYLGKQGDLPYRQLLSKAPWI